MDSMFVHCQRCSTFTWTLKGQGVYGVRVQNLERPVQGQNRAKNAQGSGNIPF